MHFLLVFALSLLTLRANEQSGLSPPQLPLEDNNKHVETASTEKELNNIITTKPAAVDPTTQPAKTETKTTVTTTVTTKKSTTTTTPHLRVNLPGMCLSAQRCYRDKNCGTSEEAKMMPFKKPIDNVKCALIIVRIHKGENGRETERTIEFQTPDNSVLRLKHANKTIEFDPVAGTVTCKPEESCDVVDSGPAQQKETNGGLHYINATIKLQPNPKASPQRLHVNKVKDNKEKSPKEDNTGTIIICCVAGVAIVIVIAIGVIALYQRRLNKRAAAMQELAKGTKTSGCIGGAALAHKLSNERRPLVSTPKEPTPPPQRTPKLDAESGAGSVVEVDTTSGGTLRPTNSQTETLYQEKKEKK